MDEYQSTIVLSVPSLASKRHSKKVRPMNGQQHHRNNTNQSISNEQQRSSYTPPFFIDNIKSSPNNQFIGMPRARGETGLKNKDASSLFAASKHSVQSKNSNTKDTNDKQRRRRLEAWLIFAGIVHTVLTLTVMLISIYLLMVVTKTSTTATDQIQLNETNSSVTTKQSYYCSGVSSFTLWTLFATIGITMNINTGNCSFNSTPLYFTSMAGIGQHWNSGGYGAIYAATKNSFTVYVQPLTAYSNTLMFNYSQMYQWNVNWFGLSD